VLDKLDKMTKKFVYTVSKRKGFSEAEARAAGGKIVTFGSYKLGAYASGT
jgi:poly(A) polymerase